MGAIFSSASMKQFDLLQKLGKIEVIDGIWK